MCSLKMIPGSIMPSHIHNYYVGLYNSNHPVFQNNIFIEPENVQYLEEGGVLQTDGSYKPSNDRFGGANYFERESQILHMVCGKSCY